MAARSRIILYYDVVSPWSFVAFRTLRAYGRFWQRDVDLQLEPCNLGGVMKNAGNKPPITVANKGRWMFESMALASEFFGTPLQTPPDFPFNSFPIQCLLHVIKAKHSPAVLEEATEHFYMRVWGEGKAVRTPEDIRSELNDLVKSGKLGSEKLNVDALMDEAGQKETRAKLNDEAKRLVEEGGAFGAPWIVTVRGSDGAKQSWFGSDRMEQIAHWLKLPYKGPLAGETPTQSRL